VPQGRLRAPRGAGSRAEPAARQVWLDPGCARRV